MSDHIEGLQKLKESGVEVSMLDDAPELLPEAAYFKFAFDYLSTGRNVNDAKYQPIKMTELESFCRMAIEHDPMYLMSFIKPLDKIFLKFYNESD